MTKKLCEAILKVCSPESADRHAHLNLMFISAPHAFSCCDGGADGRMAANQVLCYVKRNANLPEQFANTAHANCLCHDASAHAMLILLSKHQQLL